MKQYIRVFIIQPGGWLLLSILFFFADLDEFLIVVFCAMIHEFGHLIALHRFGIPVRRIALEATGMTIYCNPFLLFGGRELITAVAGPGLGIMAALFFSWLGELFASERLYLLGGCNAVLSVFNLLPAKPLDGWRCVRVIAPRLAQGISVCTSILILFVGLVVMYMGFGTAPALMGIVLLMQDSTHTRRRKDRFQ